MTDLYGSCVTCGTQTYEVNAITRYALSVPGVVTYGRCLYCFPDPAPQDGPMLGQVTAVKGATRTNQTLVSSGNTPQRVGDVVGECASCGIKIYGRVANALCLHCLHCHAPGSSISGGYKSQSAYKKALKSQSAYKKALKIHEAAKAAFAAADAALDLSHNTHHIIQENAEHGLPVLQADSADNRKCAAIDHFEEQTTLRRSKRNKKIPPSRTSPATRT
jgi:hypothetical protein